MHWDYKIGLVIDIFIFIDDLFPREKLNSASGSDYSASWSQ